MKLITFALLFTLCYFTISNSQAVNLSQNDQGQVLLYPYYTVNNNLNTIYSIINTTDTVKALVINFYEGEIGRTVLSFNIYLGPYDVWNAALIPTTSTFSGHEGEQSTKHLTDDNSCAPFLPNEGVDFLPFEIDLDENNNMQRATDGHFEVIEMGVITGSFANAISHDSGVPNNCLLLEDAWLPSGIWDIDPTFEVDQPSGGLAGSASLVNVSEGITFNYSAVALNNFWEEDGIHGSPGSREPKLDAASPVSSVLHDNQVYISEWNSGYEAVSAVLIKQDIFNEYDLTEFNDSQSEWVITFPTKLLHFNEFTLTPPYDDTVTSNPFCEEFINAVRDRAGFDITLIESNIHPIPPPGENPSLCYQSSVIQFLSDNQSPSVNTSKILGSDNLFSIYGFNESFSTEGGWFQLSFNSPAQIMTDNNGVKYHGLPAVGFKVQKFTNLNAQPGLIAQYGTLNNHKSKRRILND